MLIFVLVRIMPNVRFVYELENIDAMQIISNNILKNVHETTFHHLQIAYVLLALRMVLMSMKKVFSQFYLRMHVAILRMHVLDKSSNSLMKLLYELEISLSID